MSDFSLLDERISRIVGRIDKTENELLRNQRELLERIEKLESSMKDKEEAFSASLFFKDHDDRLRKLEQRENASQAKETGEKRAS